MLLLSFLTSLGSTSKSRTGNMATDIRTSELKKPIDVAEYLFRRLHEVGVRAVHGLPGDYNLGMKPTQCDCS